MKITKIINNHSAFSACPARPVAPVDGTGVGPEDRTGTNSACPVAPEDGTGVRDNKMEVIHALHQRPPLKKSFHTREFGIYHNNAVT
jgi:hypothetical protein